MALWLVRHAYSPWPEPLVHRSYKHISP